MNTRARNNNRNSGRYNITGQFVSAGELAPGPAPQPPQQQQQQPHYTTYYQNDQNDQVKPKNELQTPNQNLTAIPQDVSENVDMGLGEDAGVGQAVQEGQDGQERPKWMKTKLPGVKKVSNKERRRRQNQTLRRLLTPKNALMVLNEMVPNDKVASNFVVEPSSNSASYYGKSSAAFAACLTLDGENYKGFGDNKLSARNAAAELAIRDIIIRRMNKLLAQDGSVSGEESSSSACEEESLPMLQLASFALHKLFAEWEGDGLKVPQLRPRPHDLSSEVSPMESSAPHAPGAPHAPAPPAKAKAKKPRSLPLNAAAMHPCMLLTYMRPSLEYKELSAEGDKPQNMVYTMSVTVDGNVYTGQASSKKEARKEAAHAACSHVFGVTFDARPTDNAPQLPPPGDH